MSSSQVEYRSRKLSESTLHNEKVLQSEMQGLKRIIQVKAYMKRWLREEVEGFYDLEVCLENIPVGEMRP